MGIKTKTILLWVLAALITVIITNGFRIAIGEKIDWITSVVVFMVMVVVGSYTNIKKNNL
jgi:uncharacterized membrane protein